MSAKKKQPMALKRDINLAQTDRKGTPPKTAAAVAVCLALFGSYRKRSRQTDHL